MKKTIDYIIESIVELKHILFEDKEATKDTIGGIILFACFPLIWIVCVALL